MKQDEFLEAWKRIDSSHQSILNSMLLFDVVAINRKYKEGHQAPDIGGITEYLNNQNDTDIARDLQTKIMAQSGREIIIGSRPNPCRL